MGNLTCEDVGCRCIEDPVNLARENDKLRARVAALETNLRDMLDVKNECIAKLVAENKAVEALLRRVEWAGDFCDDPACPVCLCRAYKGIHTKDCALAKALGENKGETK